MNYTPLYIKTDNTLLSSLIKIPELIKYAIEHNLKSLTITDNTMYGVMDFYMSCKKNNIKPIVGLEIKLEESILILYCMNFKGYQNLLKINTINSEHNLTIADLEEYSSDLICLVPYEYYELYNKVKGLYQYIYRTYKNKNEKEDIKELSLYMNKTLCLDKKYLKYLRYLESLESSIPVSNITNKYYDNFLHLEEEIKEFNDTNNYTISELCNLEIPMHQDLMPKYVNDLGITSYEYLKKKCIIGLQKRFGNKVNIKYQERLKHELDVINKMNFCDYFLIVSDYVLYAKNNNIIVGPGRGSAVSSLVSYLLEITDVDPIKHDLIFERFLNINRISMPDIDIDFEHIHREDVINYCISKYGEKKVTPIITFSTMGAKQVIRDLGKTLDIDLRVIDNFTKLINSDLNLKDNYSKKEIIEYIKNNSLEELADLSIIFEGLKHHISIHAAGVVMSNIDLDNIIPIVKYHDNAYISAYDMTYLEEIGLLKMDFLAIKYLTIIHEIIDEVNLKYNLNLTFDEIKESDPKALDIFKKGNTLGIFQFESEGMINFLKKMKPNSMDDLCDAMALYRPGPMANIDAYINNKNNPSKIKYLVKETEEILKPTYSILIYQEQIMQIACKLASFTQGDADILRKAMSKKKKDLLIEEKEKFINGSIKNGIDKLAASKIFDLMLKFSEYGFNKSHSVGYSLVSYKMAYLKAYYPDIFISKLLTMEINDKNKLKKYLYECKEQNINILKPNINISTNTFIEYNGNIIYPLSGIKNISFGIAREIIKERENGKFIDIYDFIKRCYSKTINEKVIESLITASAFDTFGINKHTLLYNLDLIINYGELLSDVNDIETLKPILKEMEDYSVKEELKLEMDMFGIYLSNHPTLTFKGKYKNIVDLNNLDNYFDKVVNVIVYVDNVREIMTKKNDKMCFISGSDELTNIDLTIFPKIYDIIPKVENDNILLVNGKVEKRYDKLQIIVNDIKILD